MDVRHGLIHEKLKNFSFFHSFHELTETNEKAIEFLEEVQLIPSKTSAPPICCNLPMVVESRLDKKLGWIWHCSSKGSKKKGSNQCRHIVNPSIGTFFDGVHCHIDICEVLAIIICFVLKMEVSFVYEHLLQWRRHKKKSVLSWSTVIDYYSYCREIAEVIVSHADIRLGGENKTVQIDEIFLTKRKYHRGRLTEQMSLTVLGLYCKEEKVGVFFKVNSKRKSDLWPYIKKYVDQNTSYFCTDSAKQYQGLQTLFTEGTVHLQTDHSKGEYVSCNNPRNTINDLENQNKLLKRSILCRRTPKLLHQYMALFQYRKHYLEKEYKNDAGSQIMQFLLDIKKVYPGVTDGVIKEGLELKEIDPPTLESENLTEIVLSKQPRMITIDEELENLSEEVLLDEDSTNLDSDFNKNIVF